jgi:heat shock protein HslJ
MLHSSFRFVCTSLLVVFAAACSTSPTAPTPGQASSASAYTAAQLEGTWSLTSIHPAGTSPQQRPDNAVYSITFATDGRLSTRADCNVCGGAFNVSGATLTAGPNLACTRAFCQTASFESAYTSMLSGESVVTATGSTLTLASARGTIQFVR